MKWKDRVFESSVTAGTGALTLAGARSGYQSFDTALNDGDKVPYCITDKIDWETGWGTFDSGAGTLSRDTVYDSSNSGALVDFAARTKDVFITPHAGEIQRSLVTLYRLGL